MKEGVFDMVTQAIDHIIPIKLRPDLRLVRSNLQGLCFSHHNAKTRAENQTPSEIG
jgi:5-methylcytosine-specific restriction endonuclease McrA